MARRRTSSRSHVISIRISDEEFDRFNSLMTNMQIRRVSDLMRQAMELIMEKPVDQFQTRANRI